MRNDFLDLGDLMPTLQSCVYLKNNNNNDNNNVQGEMLLGKHKPIFWPFLMQTLCLKW